MSSDNFLIGYRVAAGMLLAKKKTYLELRRLYPTVLPGDRETEFGLGVQEALRDWAALCVL